MVIGFYVATLIISTLLLAILINKFYNKISPCYILLFSSMIVSNLGYIFLYRSETIEEALLANIIPYVGSAFAPLCVIFCICDLCHVNIKKPFTILLTILAIIDFTLPFTVGYTDIYYKNATLEFAKGYSYIVKQYGPLHIYHILYISFGMLVTSSLFLYVCIKKNRVSFNIIGQFVTIMLLISMTYIIERLCKSKIDFMPLSYCIGEAIILLMLNRIKFFNVSSSYIDVLVQQSDSGLFIIDNKNRFCGSNVVADNWFPEIKELSMDKVVNRSDTPFFKQLQQWIENGNEGDTQIFDIDDKKIEIKLRKIRDGRKISLYIEMKDDTQTQKYIELLNKYNDSLKKEVEYKADNLNKIQDDIMVGMASIVENRDADTGGHIKRTSDVVEIFSKYLVENKIFSYFDINYAKYVIKAAPLHDFGKVAISDSILNKNGKYSIEEYNEMKKHSELGAKIVAKILSNVDDLNFKKIAINVAHYHHERWDGSGYPEGLSGYNIPLESRIMALADVYDALVSKRCYKEKMSYDEAFNIIKESTGTQFDPQLGILFLNCRDKIINLYDSYNV